MLATHDLDVAEGLLSRALYLRNGRLLARRTPAADTLRERYRAVMTAS